MKRGKKRTIEEYNPWERLAEFDPELNESKHKQHAGTSYRYSLDNYCAWFQHGKLHKLSRAAQIDSWEQTAKFIGYKTRSHFKRMQFNEDYKTERILSYYEWALLWWDKNPPWIRFAFERNFAQIEAVLQCRRLGIALPHNSCLLNCKTKFIKYFVIYFICKRQNIDYETYFISTYGYKEMYPDVQLEYEFYLNRVESVVNAASYYTSVGFYGSHELGISFDDSAISEAYENTDMDAYDYLD